MKRAVLFLGSKRIGKDDLPVPQEPWQLLFADANDGDIHAPEDLDLAARLSDAPPSARCRLRVHVDGFDASFETWLHYKRLIRIFGQRNMPRGFSLTGREELGTAGNRHWLSRLPATMKTWSFRRKVLDFVTGEDPLVRRYLQFHIDRGGLPPNLTWS